MDLIGLMHYGEPLLILGLLVYLERINAKIHTIHEDVQEIKKGITWLDTCTAKHDEINRRLVRIERKVLNGTV